MDGGGGGGGDFSPWIHLSTVTTLPGSHIYLAWRRMASTGYVERPEPARGSPNWTLVMLAGHRIGAGVFTLSSHEFKQNTYPLQSLQHLR